MLQKSPWRSRATALLLATAAFAQACSSTDTTTTTGTIAVALTPTSATIQQGASTVVTGTLTLTNFTGTPTVTVEGMPAGVSGTVALSGNAATVTLTAASTTAVGAYTLTVRAQGTGLTDATANFTLTIAVATTASYTMTVGAPTLSIAQGTPGNATLTFVRTNFTGNVALSIDNLPTGVTAAFVPNPATALTSTLTLTVASTAAAGLTNLVIRGTSAGLTDVTAPLVLTVTATPSFTVGATPAALSLVQGTTNITGGVKATRVGGFTGTIVYSLAGAPTGVTAAFATTTVTDSMQVSITATSAVAAGVYVATIHGVSGTIDQTTPLSITVTAATGGGSVRLDYSACVTASKPVWVAFQDGTGAWTRVIGTGDVYTFNVASTRGALAIVTANGAVFNTAVQYFSQAELAANVGGCTAVTTKLVNGSVAGLNAGDAAKMSMGGSTTGVTSNAVFSLTSVASGTFDLVGYRRNSGTPGVLDRGFLRRDQNITAGGTMVVSDFTSGTESFAAATANATVAGGGGGDVIIQTMSYLAGAACTSNGLYNVATGTATAFAIFGVPTAQQRATDFHSMALIDANGTQVRSLTVNFHTMADRTFTFGALLTPTVTNVTASLTYKRLQAAVTLPADYGFAFFSYTDTPGNGITVTQSAAYLAGATALTLSPPDFTGTAGLTTTWFPAAAAAVNWSLTGITVPAAACAEGATTRFASVSGTM